MQVSDNYPLGIHYVHFSLRASAMPLLTDEKRQSGSGSSSRPQLYTIDLLILLDKNENEAIKTLYKIKLFFEKKATS